MVPDTLDLEERARLAINCLTETTDPEADYEIYWRVLMRPNPPMMLHHFSDLVQAKLIEDLPLLRLACGSEQNPQVEQRWMEVMLQMQGPDGLLYFPKIGRPWYHTVDYGPEPPGDHYAVPLMIGRFLGAMTIYHLLTGEGLWKEAGRRLVEGLNNLAIHEGEKAHFAWHQYGTEKRYTKHDPALAIQNPASWHCWALQGLSNYYRYTGDETARSLVEEMARWIIEDSKHFDSSGRFLEEYPGVSQIHFHSHTMVLVSLLDHGIVTGDNEVIEFARKGFEYGMRQGECLLGYFPEWLDLDGSQTLEICELSDMIALAVKLSQCGAGDYWDMADRWLRNLFAEGQLRRAEWVYWMAEKSAPSVIPPYHTAERAIERNIGAFGGHMSPNDFLADKFPYETAQRDGGIIHCCTGNASRTIYYAWENILTHKEGKLKVNLLLNRSSKWADVNSHIPYTGQVDLKVKEPLDLSIRIPEWVKSKEVTCTVNGEETRTSWDARYCQVGKVKQKDEVTLNFPIHERSEQIHVQQRTYKVLLRGNTAVAIDPPGANCPLFQRDHYRESIIRWKKTERFLSDKEIEW